MAKEDISKYSLWLEWQMRAIISDESYLNMRMKVSKESDPRFKVHLDALIEWCKIPEQDRMRYEGFREAREKLYEMLPMLKESGRKP